jgi:hypothetical protein
LNHNNWTSKALDIHFWILHSNLVKGINKNQISYSTRFTRPAQQSLWWNHPNYKSTSIKTITEVIKSHTWIHITPVVQWNHEGFQTDQHCGSGEVGVRSGGHRMRQDARRWWWGRGSCIVTTRGTHVVHCGISLNRWSATKWPRWDAVWACSGPN